MRFSASWLALLSIPFVSSCTEADSDPEGEPTVVEGTSADIGPAGGELTAPPDSGFAGFSIKIPAGALSETVKVSFAGVTDDTSLPETAERVGPQIAIEPAGTKLSKPAELTVPLDPDLLSSFEGSPDVCKVWARDGEGWKKIEASRHGLGSVTVPIETFATAAAGVNFTALGTCKAGGTCTTTPLSTAAQCESVSAGFCLLKLPRPSNMTFLDEFASLRVVGRKVYWAARIDGEPTVLRYDLDNPGEAFVYPPYNGPADGTISTRGKVAVLSENEVWATFAGYGNIRFLANGDPTAFDRPPTVQAVGVSSNASGVVRFYRQSGGSNTMDVRVAFNNDTALSASRFLFNYAKVIPGSNPFEVNPSENIQAQGSKTAFTFRSLHRGIGKGFKANGVTDGAGFYGVEFGMPGSQIGTVLDNDTKTFGPAAFSNTDRVPEMASQFKSDGKVGTIFVGLFDADNPLSLPVAARDIALRDSTSTVHTVAIASGRSEIYLLDNANRLTTLDIDDPAFTVPWRVERVKNPIDDDVLVVTRGSIIAKGDFYLLKKKAL